VGGREAIRGFSIQTLVCLLDSLQTQNGHWMAVTIEPDSGNDKVDILWEFSGGFRRVQQVKSSQNQIGRADVATWCSELKASGKADSYQLILAGPIAASVLQDAPFDDVEVPIPSSLDTLALIDQAITKVDRYLLDKGINSLPLAIRESLIHIISSRLLEGAVHGKRLTREEFDGWILYWITSAYPEAIEQRLSANCESLWSTIEFASPNELSKRAFELIIPITMINGGLTTTVVEWFLLRISSLDCEMRYRPTSILNADSTDLKARRLTARPFGEFAIAPQSAVCKDLLFVHIDRAGYQTGQWQEGEYDIEMYVKYAGVNALQSLKKASISIGTNEGSILGTTKTVHMSLSSLEDYLELL